MDVVDQAKNEWNERDVLHRIKEREREMVENATGSSHDRIINPA